MPAIAVKKNAQVARPLKVLVPLIKNELMAADRAGIEHYRQAGQMLIEAKEQMPYGSWGKWLSKNFELSRRTAFTYMQLAQQIGQSIGNASDVEKRRFTSVSAALGREYTATHAHQSFRPVIEAARDLDAELFAQERQTRDDEIRLHRELALELVDLGYKAMATRLHPDRGGSKDAMARLNRVRDELKQIAETRRFV